MSAFLGELLYSAVLWGSLITLLLWWLRRRTSHTLVRALVTVPLVWFGVHTAIAWYGFWIPVSGGLTDADTGKPIANARVISTWHSYPLGLWTSYCSGRQAHLTDENGRFVFRLAPFPTLLVGTRVRGINPRVPGRINNRTLRNVLVPIWGDVEIQQYAPGRSVSRSGPNTECKVQIAPQYSTASPIPGEQHPFEVMYREACVEHQAWSLTDKFMTEMMLSRPKDSHDRASPPEHILEGLASLVGFGCDEGICVRAIPEATRDMFCEYYGTIRTAGEVKE